MKMVFTELKSHAEEIKETFRDDEVIIYDRPLNDDELINAARGAEILSVFIYSRVTEEVIDALPDLRLIVTRSVGFDHIAAKHALSKGIAVCHIPDYGSHVIAEHVFALLLAAARKIPFADIYVKEKKKFDFEQFLGLELKGKTLGIIGTGKIGAAVMSIASGFGMKIVAYDVYENKSLQAKYGFPYLSLEELLSISDFVTLHIPLTPNTYHLINKDTIAKMKKGSILINASRGGVVDSLALKDALESGHLWGAGIDVLEDETHPERDVLLSAPNIIITPHSAFYTKETLQRIIQTTIDTIRSYKMGNTINKIPMEYL
ncbi:MAG: NAD(P)-dependent oxidoreductase [Methanomassiliicoccales archaeon]|jgi:D-lactate dehydrogenase|nr:NAD(P)-dependent oxidoreductase [Methanomassiliicoccales archaeon]